MSLILKQILALRVADIIVRRSNPQIRDALPGRKPKIDRVTPEWSMWIAVTPNPKKPEDTDYLRSREEQLYDDELAIMEQDEAQFSGPDKYGWDQFA